MIKKGYNSTEWLQLPQYKRKQMADQQKSRRPANFPTIFIRHASCTLPDLPECRTTLKYNLQFMQIKQDIKKILYAGKAADKEALFFFHNGILIPDGMTVKDAVEKYDKSKDKDGWFYISYHSQETF